LILAFGLSLSSPRPAVTPAAVVDPPAGGGAPNEKENGAAAAGAGGSASGGDKSEALEDPALSAGSYQTIKGIGKDRSGL